jgi:hypothetical protein
MAAGGTLRDDTLPGTSAVEGGAFGLYPASDFRLTDGRCRDCRRSAGALVLQRGDHCRCQGGAIHCPLSPPAYRPQPTSARGSPVANPPPHPNTPPLIWVAAPHVVAGARLSRNATFLDSPGGALHAALVPKIPLNRLVLRRVLGGIHEPQDAQGAWPRSTAARS